MQQDKSINIEGKSMILLDNGVLKRLQDYAKVNNLNSNEEVMEKLLKK